MLPSKKNRKSRSWSERKESNLRQRLKKLLWFMSIPKSRNKTKIKNFLRTKGRKNNKNSWSKNMKKKVCMEGFSATQKERNFYFWQE